jgi:hypothetical protein
MENKNREKLLLIATAVCVALYLGNMLIIDPLIDSWHSRTAEIKKLKTDIDAGHLMVRRQQSIQDQWDYMRGFALSNTTASAEREMLASFTHWVDTGGVASGSFRPQPQEPESNYTAIDCRADVSGNPDTMREFLRSMSHDRTANKVTSFELSSKDDNGRQLVLGLSTTGLILETNDPSQVQIPPDYTNEPPVDTNAPDPFKTIALNNIFDQTRVFNTPRPIVPVHVAKVETLTAHGAGTDASGGAANFESTGIVPKIDPSKFYPKGSQLGDFKLAAVGNETVTLMDAESNSYVLPTDGSSSLKREDGGPWKYTGYVPPVETHETNSANAATNPGAAGSPNAVLEMLRKRRESAN